MTRKPAEGISIYLLPTSFTNYVFQLAMKVAKHHTNSQPAPVASSFSSWLEAGNSQLFQNDNRDSVSSPLYVFIIHRSYFFIALQVVAYYFAQYAFTFTMQNF
jgi:hypothetical protein